MHRFIDTLGGIGELLLIAARAGFRLNRPYWRWRRETAFGPPDAAQRLPRIARIRAMLEYGRWVYRMKRGR
jgi:hypothetical protein